MGLFSRAKPARIEPTIAVSVAPEQETKSADFGLDSPEMLRAFAGGYDGSAEAALAVPAIYAAVNLVARSIAALPINLLEESQSDRGVSTRRIRRDHWAARLIRRPCSHMTQFEFWDWMIQISEIHDIALARLTFVRGEVREMLPVPPSAWSMAEPLNPESDIMLTLQNATIERLPRSDFLVLTSAALNTLRPVARSQRFAASIRLARVLEAQQSEVADNFGRASGILTAPPGASDTARKKAAEAIRGGVGPGKSPVLDDGWKFAPLSGKMTDQQHLENREMANKEAARIWQVPAYMLDAEGSDASAASESALQAFVQFSLVPRITRIEQALDRDVLGNRRVRGTQGLRFDIAEGHLLRGNRDAQADYYVKALGTGGNPGWLSIDEVRDEQGYPEIGEEWSRTVNRGAGGGTGLVRPAGEGSTSTENPENSAEAAQ